MEQTEAIKRRHDERNISDFKIFFVLHQKSLRRLVSAEDSDEPAGIQRTSKVSCRTFESNAETVIT